LAILIYPALYALSYALGKILNLETTETLIDLNWGFCIAFLLTFFTTGSVEEFGWRGYLQKEAQKKYSPLITSLIIAAVWMLWHLPLHFNGFYPSDLSFFSRITLALQLAFLFTWFYNRSGYSILTVMILHAMNNNVGRVFGSSYLPAVALGVGLIIYFIIDNKMWKNKSYHNQFYG
jgi:membrane protease YdiL (CAAX protease family)